MIQNLEMGLWTFTFHDMSQLKQSLFTLIIYSLKNMTFHSDITVGVAMLCYTCVRNYLFLLASYFHITWYPVTFSSFDFVLYDSRFDLFCNVMYCLWGVTITGQENVHTLKTKLSAIGVLPKWNRNSLNSANSVNLINHWSMNWSQFKDPVSNMYLAGTVVASWSLRQEVAGWRVRAILLQWQIFLSLNSVKTFRENSNRL